MNPSSVPLPPLAGAVASALIGALFAGADSAITSLSATRLEALIDQSSGRTKRAFERIQKEDAKLRSRYLLGRVASTAVTAVCLLQVFEPFLGDNAAWLSLAVTVLVTSLLFEISTTMCRSHADRIAPAAARWMIPLELAILPLASPLGWLGAALSRRNEQPLDLKVAEAEMEALVDEGERSGLFAREPAEMIRNVIDFSERTAKDVMIPRFQVEGIEVTTPLDEVHRIVAASGHSRYPVYREQIDNVVGLIYAKDLFKAAHDTHEEGKPPEPTVQRVEDLLRQPNFVAESRLLSSLLKEMRSRRQHLAIVVDEFGSVSGIVTLEDVLEVIVGDIRDEHDTEEEAGIEDLGDGHVVAHADVSLRELLAYLGAEVEPASENESLGAMLTHHLGKIPEVGTAFSKFGLRFIVRDSDASHIGKVEVLRP